MAAEQAEMDTSESDFSTKILPEILSADGQTVIPAVRIRDVSVSGGHRVRIFEPTANTNADLHYRRLPTIE